MTNVILDPAVPQSSQNEEKYPAQTEDVSYERETARSSSPNSSLSPAGSRSGTDATEFDEGDGLRGMNAHDCLPPLSDHDKATWAKGGRG